MPHMFCSPLVLWAELLLLSPLCLVLSLSTCLPAVTQPHSTPQLEGHHECCSHCTESSSTQCPCGSLAQPCQICTPKPPIQEGLHRPLALNLTTSPSLFQGFLCPYYYLTSHLLCSFNLFIACLPHWDINSMRAGSLSPCSLLFP